MTLLWRVIRALVAFLFVAVLVLVAEGYRKGAGEIRMTTEFNATPQHLWPWLEEGEKAKQWVSWLVEVRTDPRATTPVGRTEIWVMHDANNSGKPMEVAGTCTEYTPYTRMSVHLSTPGSFEGDQTYVLTDLGGGRTKLEILGKYRYAMWLARLMEPLITPSAEKKMVADVARLKSLVERQNL